MEPVYDVKTEKAREVFVDAYDRECFDDGFRVGWHCGGEAGLGRAYESWETGRRHGARQWGAGGRS